MQLVIGNTYESSRGFGRLLYLGETHDIDGYLPTFRTTKGDLKFYGYDRLQGALVELAAPTISRADELIACLEGEVKSRDARVAELEDSRRSAEASLDNAQALNVELRAELARVVQADAHYQAESLRLASELADTRDKMRAVVAECCEAQEELAAIKAQEPVAYIPVDRGTGDKWPPVYVKGSGKICDYAPLYAAQVAKQVVMPDNLLSHRVTWRQALVRLIELEDVADPETGRDDKAYWQHELLALDAMYADLDRLNTADQEGGV